MTSTASRSAPGLMRWALGMGLVTALVLVAAMYIRGDPPGDVPAGLPDPGLVTGWGLPTAKILADLAGIVTVGLLLTGAFLLPGDGDEIRGLAARAVHGARWAAGLWSLALVVLLDRKSVGEGRSGGRG